MLHIKFQGHRSIGFGIEDFKRFQHMWATGYIRHVTWTIGTYFYFPIPLKAGCIQTVVTIGFQEMFQIIIL